MSFGRNISKEGDANSGEMSISEFSEREMRNIHNESEESEGNTRFSHNSIQVHALSVYM